MSDDYVSPYDTMDLAALAHKLGVEAEPAPTARPSFGRLQQLDRKDDYRLAINGDLVTGLKWADLGQWSLVQDKHNRQFPEHALDWKPDHEKSLAELRLLYKTRFTRQEYEAHKDIGEDEWGVIVRRDLLPEIEHVTAEAELTATVRALAVLKAWLLRAPKTPAQPALRWRDKRYGQEATYYFNGKAAVETIQQAAGCDLSSGEVLKMVRELGGKSEVVHVPGPGQRKVRAYKLTERKLQRLKVPELEVDPDYIPGVELAEIDI